MAQEGHSPVLIFRHPVLILHSLVLIFNSPVLMERRERNFI